MCDVAKCRVATQLICSCATPGGRGRPLHAQVASKGYVLCSEATKLPRTQESPQTKLKFPP